MAFESAGSEGHSVDVSTAIVRDDLGRSSGRYARIYRLVGMIYFIRSQLWVNWVRVTTLPSHLRTHKEGAVGGN